MAVKNNGASCFYSVLLLKIVDIRYAMYNELIHDIMAAGGAASG